MTSSSLLNVQNRNRIQMEYNFYEVVEVGRIALTHINTSNLQILHMVSMQ